MTSAELARLIYDNYPGSDLFAIDPDECCKDMDTLRDVANSGQLGDGLFRFIVEEIYETSVIGDEIDTDQGISALMAAHEDIECVLNAIVEAQHKEDPTNG
jgi:hypothetical protein